MKRIFYLTKKEFIQTFRDKRMIGLIFIAPVLQLVLFGFAVTLDVNNAYFAVWDQDRSIDSRQLIQAFSNTGNLKLVGSVEGRSEIDRFFREGQGDMILIIPPDFAKRLAAGKSTEVQGLFDGSDSNYASLVSNYASGIIARFNQEKLGETAFRLSARLGRQIPLGQGAPVSPSVRVWYNPDLKSSVFMVPAVVCMLLMIITIILTTLAITKEKEIGTIEHLIVTPIKPYQLIMGKMLPFAIIGFVDVTLIVIAAQLLFDVPFRGSIALLYLGSLVFLFATLGLGLFFSTISKTQQQAMFMTFMFTMPAVLLSGFMFPINNMPEAIQLFTYINPLRYFLVIVRGIFLKGTGLDTLWPQFAALAALGLTIFSLAVSRFNKTLE